MTSREAQLRLWCDLIGMPYVEPEEPRLRCEIMWKSPSQEISKPAFAALCVIGMAGSTTVGAGIGAALWHLFQVML